jgi:hypothetical protein
MGITTRIGSSTEGISSSVHIYQKLSKEFSDDIQWITQSLVALQDQVDSLAPVVL